MRWWLNWRRQKWLNSPPPSGKGNIGGEPLPFKLQTEPLIGHRYWRVTIDRNSGHHALQSIHVGMIWERNEVAQCNPGGYKYGKGGHEDPPPSLECACGLYAQLPDMPITEWWFAIGGKVYASGEVSLTGRVIKCTRGYKAEKAEILSPIYLDVSCSGDGNSCPQPVEVIALPNAGVTHYWGYCEEHRQEHEDAVLLDADVWFPEAARELSDRYGIQVLHWR